MTSMEKHQVFKGGGLYCIVSQLCICAAWGTGNNYNDLSSICRKLSIYYYVFTQESPWSAASGFNVDPFGQPSVKTPTDLFAGGDPFGSDPFGTKLGSTNGSNNPFGVSGDDMFGGSQKES